MNIVRIAIERHVPETLFKGKQPNYELQHVLKALTELEFINALYFDEETQRQLKLAEAFEKAIGKGLIKINCKACGELVQIDNADELIKMVL